MTMDPKVFERAFSLLERAPIHYQEFVRPILIRATQDESLYPFVLLLSEPFFLHLLSGGSPERFLPHDAYGSPETALLNSSVRDAVAAITREDVLRRIDSFIGHLEGMSQVEHRMRILSLRQIFLMTRETLVPETPYHQVMDLLRLAVDDVNQRFSREHLVALTVAVALAYRHPPEVDAVAKALFEAGFSVPASRVPTT